jgi:hypothetical protein
VMCLTSAFVFISRSPLCLAHKNQKPLRLEETEGLGGAAARAG